MFRLALALGFLLAGSSVLAAQDQPVRPSYTQLLLGVGHTSDEATWALGVEHKPGGSSIAWRLLLEQWDHHTVLPSADQPDFSAQRYLGAQVLGLRLFRQARRVQPYFLGGFAMYRERYIYGFSPWIPNGDGTFSRGPIEAGHGERVHSFMLWGSGLNVRVSGATLFGELKLPLPGTMKGERFTAAPLLFGIRF